MNVGRSINIAMAKRDMRRADLAKVLGTTTQNIKHLIDRDNTSSENLRKLASVFEMSVSDFIKLGED